MNYLEYSNIPSAILNVQKEHITDNDVDATSTRLVQFLHLHCNTFVDFSFFIFYVITCPVGPGFGVLISSS
jgi:hypothetical protein